VGGLTHVDFIWLTADYHATVLKNILVATEGELKEHWLSIFRDTLYDSSLEMIKYSPPITPAVIEITHLPLFVKPIRQSLRNWCGCEGVMKVALELAKQVCRVKSCSIPYVALQPLKFDSVPGGKFTSWGAIFRFQLMVYVPGFVWTARQSVDYVRTEQESDMPILYRDTFKLIHLCADFEGDLAVHDVSEYELRQLSDT
jgi:hypothetical protein